MSSLLRPVLMPFQGSCGHASGCSGIREMLGCWAAIRWRNVGELKAGQERDSAERHTGVAGTLRWAAIDWAVHVL